MHGGAQAKMMANGVAHLVGNSVIVAAEFYMHVHVVEVAAPVDIDGKFGDLWKLAHDVLYGAGVEDNAAHDESVVAAADNAAVEALVGATAGARLVLEADAVSGVVANDGHAIAAEIGDDEFSLVGGCAAGRIDDFADEFGFVEMETGALLALETPGADFGGASVVKAAGSPSVF